MTLHPTSFLIQFKPKPGTCGLPPREKLSQCLSAPASSYDNKRYRLQTERWRFTMLIQFWENMFHCCFLGHCSYELEVFRLLNFYYFIFIFLWYPLYICSFISGFYYCFLLLLFECFIYIYLYTYIYYICHICSVILIFFIILSLCLSLFLCYFLVGPGQGICGICYFAKSGSPQICEEGLWLHFNGSR